MNRSSFDELLDSVKEMDRVIHGNGTASRVTHFADPEVKKIREKTGLSQIRFATLIGVSKRTLENWEQGRRQPTGPAKALLRIVDSDPQLALRALHG